MRLPDAPPPDPPPHPSLPASLNPDTPRTQRGIQSVEVGGQLLLVLGRHQGLPMSLSDLAREAGMSASKAHPYLVSFGKLGMIEQDMDTGRYRLGPTLLRLGLVCLQRLDVLAVATPLMAELAARVEHSLAISVWGSFGPTVVRMFESSRPIHVNMRTGTVMALAGTATGRAFAAWMAPGRVAMMLERLSSEVIGVQHDRLAASDRAGFELELAAIRQAGYAHTEGRPIPGVNAVAAPVFDFAGEVSMVITALGPADSFPTGPEAETTRAVRQCAAEISHRLGSGAVPTARGQSA